MQFILLKFKNTIYIVLLNLQVNIMIFNNNENLFQYFENHFDEFTSTQKSFIRYLINNKYEAPFLSAYEIANKINADSSTLVRFAQEIGYKGYPELQKDLGQNVINEMRYSGQLEKARHYRKPLEKNIIQLSLNKSYKNILDLLENVDEKDITHFSRVICSARKKVIVANRSSFSVGHFLYFELKKIISDVSFLSDYDHGYYDTLEGLDKSDLIIAISVPRYTRITIDFADYAAKQKVNVISITDTRISPLFAISSFCLLADTQSATFHNSNVPLMALADAIIADVFDTNREMAIERLEREEKILKDNKVIFYERRNLK